MKPMSHSKIFGTYSNRGGRDIRVLIEDVKVGAYAVVKKWRI